MKLKTKQLLAICQIVIGIIAFFILFAPGFVYEGLLKDYNFTVFEQAFGVDSDKNLGAAALGGLDASFGAIIAIALVLAVVVLAILKFVLPKQNKVLNIVIMVCAIVAAILLFCGTTALMINPGADIEVSDLSLKLGAGAIVAAVLCIVNAVVSCLDEFFVKK